MSLSELDEGRRAYLLTRMRERQTFVTSCDDAALLHTDGVICRMEGGVLNYAVGRRRPLCTCIWEGIMC